jgi:hypothetical protein
MAGKPERTSRPLIPPQATGPRAQTRGADKHKNRQDTLAIIITEPMGCVKRPATHHPFFHGFRTFSPGIPATSFSFRVTRVIS